MNLVQAIIEVNMEGRKVFKAGEHTVESCDKINCCNGSTTVDHSHNVFVKNLPALMQLDFHEVVDWGKVKQDAKVEVSYDGAKHFNDRRYFAKYENGKVRIYPHGQTSWSYTSGQILLAFNPEDVRLAE
jgi:hypothetical protein